MPIRDTSTTRADIAAMAVAYDPPDEAAASIARFRTQQRISFRVIPERTHLEID